MKKRIIRHAQSKAGTRLERVAFGGAGAELTENGLESAGNLGVALDGEGVSKAQNVAVSRLIRTQQTAFSAGFELHVVYPILDELSTEADPVEVTRNAALGILPKEAYERAEAILNNPPEQEIWFSHGLVIAGLREVLGLGFEGSNKVPHFCEITEMNV